MKKLLIILIISLVLLSGCMATTKTDVMKGMNSYHDPYLKATMITAPSIPTSQAMQGPEEAMKLPVAERFSKAWTNSGGGMGSTSNLTLTYFSHSGNIKLNIYFSDDRWKFFDSAYDINGNKLKVETNRNVHGGVRHGVASSVSISESIWIPLTENYLKENIESGIKIKLFGRGSMEVNVPSFYIKGFLESLHIPYETSTEIKTTGWKFGSDWKKTEWKCPLDDKPLYDNGSKLICEDGHGYDKP